MGIYISKNLRSDWHYLWNAIFDEKIRSSVCKDTAEVIKNYEFLIVKNLRKFLGKIPHIIENWKMYKKRTFEFLWSYRDAYHSHSCCLIVPHFVAQQFSKNRHSAIFKFCTFVMAKIWRRKFFGSNTLYTINLCLDVPWSPGTEDS